MASFKSIPLFGGAIVADVPSTFADVSNLREVPDHQEVYLDTDGLTNIIFEILQRVTPEEAATDEEALKYHYHDMVSDNTDATNFWTGSSAVLSKMSKIPAYTLFATQHLDKSAPSRKIEAEMTGILLILIRLEAQKTDIVITINVPHLKGEYKEEDIDLPAQKLGPLIEQAVAFRQRILETFEVKDWELFVNEDEE